jgi:hypothetical protein
MEHNASLRMSQSRTFLARVMAGAFLAASAIFTAGAGLAANGVLKAVDTSGIVIVWKSAAAHDEGMAKAAGGNLMDIIDSLMPLVSCLEVDGTKVNVKNKGVDSHDIHVVEGENHGCEGVIAAAELG